MKNLLSLDSLSLTVREELVRNLAAFVVESDASACRSQAGHLLEDFDKITFETDMKDRRTETACRIWPQTPSAFQSPLLSKAHADFPILVPTSSPGKIEK